MHDRVLTKQDNFAWGTDQPFPVLFGALGSSRRKILCQLLDRTRNRVHRSWFGSDIAFLGRCRELDGTCLKQGMLQVIQEIPRIFYSNTETNEIFGEASSSSGGRIDRSVSGIERFELDEIDEGGKVTYDMAHGMLINEFTHPKLTLIPQSLVPATILSLRVLSPVVKLSTAPAPSEIRSWISLSGWDSNPG